MSSFVDLHVHTGASDGLGSPEDALRLAEERGIAVVALTDHDVLDSARWCYGHERHWARAGGPVRAVPGIEISSLITVGGATDVVHIVGLGIDPYASELVDICERMSESRGRELRRRLAHARAEGYALAPEAEGRVLAHAFWGRAEISRELVCAGRFETVDSAYHAVFDSYPRSSGTQDHEPAVSAIAAIHASGGIAILAHPLRDELRRCLAPREVALARIGALSPLGLDGVEAFYRTFPLAECLWLEGVAQGAGLLVSCASDHHDHAARDRMGVTCADGRNYGSHATVLGALGLAT